MAGNKSKNFRDNMHMLYFLIIHIHIGNILFINFLRACERARTWRVYAEDSKDDETCHKEGKLNIINTHKYFNAILFIVFKISSELW